MLRRLGLRVVALGYLTVILLAPLAMVFYRTFQHGLEPVWQALSDPNTLHAFQVTLIAAAIAVPLNTVFGVLCALAIVRRRFRGKGLLNAFIDLPLAVSPVVIGLALFLIYAPRGGWFGTWLSEHGFQVLFAMPSIVLATIFVSVPFVAREVIPTLRELGNEQEQAAGTLGASRWQRFWLITLPSIRWAVIYGVILTTARCLGEYGAVAVVSGRIEGKTETATTRIDDMLQNFQTSGAYAIAVVLAVIAVLVLVADDPDQAQGGGPLDVDRGPQRHEALRRLHRRSTTCRSRSPTARSRPCSARAAPASRRCCASSPASSGRTPVRSCSRVRTRPASRRNGATSASSSSTTRRSST